MQITRRFTQAGQSVYDQFEYTLRSSVLRNPDGSVVFQMHDIEVPKGWSQVATDIMAQKYFRKAGVPQLDPNGNPLTDESGNPMMGGEQSARQVIHRLAGCWTQWGKDHGYFDTQEDAQAFYDENAYILLAQMAAPNSPQWFNTGLNYAYGITGPSQGHYYVDPTTGKLTKSKDAYTHPQPHACARGNTRLSTTAGILSIREIVEDNRTDLKVFDGEKMVSIQAVKNNGVRPIWRATLRNGNFIEFTDDHRIWSSDRRTKEGGKFDWNPLREILGWRVQQIAMPVHPEEEVFDEISVAAAEKSFNASELQLQHIFQHAGIELPNNDFADISPSSINNAKAALSGWILGDGYYGKHNRNSTTTMFGAITINNDEFAFVTGLFETLFNQYNVVTRANISNDYRIVKLDRKVVDSFVEEYELDATSFTATVPEKIFRGTSEEKRLFLRSLFQADGCVRIRSKKNAGDIVLSTISEELAHGVQLLLLSIGIYSNITVGYDSRTSRKPLYQVSISYFSERKKYEQLIGFISTDKKEKLQKLNAQIVGKQKSSLSEEEVVSIEYVGEEEVFDIQTETSRFAANGVVVHNCFIQSVSDDLVNEGGIFDLITREARIFKYGSGTGSNFSAIRAEGEPLSGGGVSSGLMSFLKVADRAAGAVKSGGTTRRAAKMVILNADHPDIENFIDWKMLEEQKVADLVAGSKMNSLFLNEIMAVAARDGDDYTEPGTELHDLVQRALNRGIPMSQIVRALALVKQGHTKSDVQTYNTHYEGEAYITASGQNSNNSVRVTNEFMDAVEQDAPWNLVRRTDGKSVKTIAARQLWQKINYAAWSCADPGLQFHTTVNEWHTSPKDGEINGSNPCSEYMFLDDTACFAPETRISTPAGLRTVEELYNMQERGQSVTITTDLYSEQDHRRITAHRPAFVTQVGTKQTYRMTLQDGRSIRVTGDHRFLTDDGQWKRVEHLQVGSDRIHIRQSGNPIAFTSNEADVRRWRALGWLTGEGVFSKGNVAMVFGPQEQATAQQMEGEFQRLVADAYTELSRNADSRSGGTLVAEPIVETELTIDSDGRLVAESTGQYRVCHLSQQANGVLQIVSKSAPLVRYLEGHYGMKQGTAVHKDVPETLHQIADDLKVAYLQGLFSADGSIRPSATEDEVMLASSSPALLRSVQLILSDMGIVSRITWNHPEGRKNPQGQLHIYNQQARKFLTLVGFPCSAEKDARAQAILAHPFSAAQKNPRPVAITSIKPDALTTVYDITEPFTHSVIAEGMIAHNCNLASINLAKFYDAETRVFDVEGYKHACRVLTVVLEVSVLMAQFPSKTIAQKSYDFRTLGLGYANIGTVLMTAGIPYDSEEGRAWAGALSAIMTGEAYATSAQMAGELGPFPNYKRNEKDMLRVIRNHRRAAYNAPDYEYEGLTIKPVGINHSLCPTNLSESAKETWDRALALGEQHGYRNAQVSVIAPTGCLVGGSLISTNRGLVPLETLGDINGQQWQDADFTVLTDQGEKQATKFYINGIAPTRTIRTSSGYEITGTLQHRVKVVDASTREWKWKRFSEITSGDILPLSMNASVGTPQTVRLPLLGQLHWNSSPRLTVPETMTPELAELVGYFMGDGSLHSKGLRFCVSKEDHDVAQRITALVASLFNLDCYLDPRQGYVEVGVNSVQLTHWWQASGFNKLQPTPDHSGKGWTPRIPNAVLYTNDPACYGAFLRGLFEADGTVTNGVPHWSSGRKSFSTQVKSLLLALGIPTTTKLDHSQWGDSTLYVVRLLNQSYNQAFQEQIGFIGARKRNAVRVVETVQSARRDYIYAEQEVIDVALSQPTERNAVMLAVQRHGAITRTSLQRVYEQTGDTEIAKALGYYYDIVEANEDGGEQLTYDISVPENVTYVANGFISHNTIALIMDCDTTGIEPDFAMVKFKKLAGGGYFKIVNSSVPAALRALGYSESEILEIERYIKGHGTLSGCPHINKQSLKERGFSDESIQTIEGQLDSVFDVKFAFNKWTLGEDVLRGAGFTQAELEDPSLNILARLGFTATQIEEANKFICGTMTIEGAPGLNPEHLPVFDCANKCGKYGQRYIQHMGHVKMMAAAQPFISGAISKTINMPNHATIDEVAHVYLESWKLMLKAIALYRDGSKLSQPLNSTADTDLVEEVTLHDATVEPTQMMGDENSWDENVGAAQIHERIVEKVYHRADRRRLPKRRHGFVREATVGGHKVFIRTGEYEDGTLGEIFIDMYKEGASFKGLLNCFAVLASKALQYGMPLEKMVDTFTFTRFEPSGPVFGHEAIKSSTSIIDYVFRALGYEYLGREDFIHVKAIDEGGTAEQKTGANAKGGGQHHGNGNGNGNGQKLSPGQSLYARQIRAVDTPTVAPPIKPMGENQKKVQTAKAQGYTGEQCGNCGSMRVRQNGTCHVCEDCGTTSGCS